MKYLNDYTQDAISKVIKDNGGFFAFSNKQFEESKQDGIKYVRLYGGLISPKNNVKNILDGIDKANVKGIKEDMKENSIKDIIWREFANYECQIVHNYDDVLISLKDYSIKKETIKKEFTNYINYCNEHNLY